MSDRHVDSACFRQGIFGDYVQDNVVVKAEKQTHVKATWVPESAGTELWRIGVPDKSAGECWIWQFDGAHHRIHLGEFKNGLERDTTHPRQPSSEWEIR